MKSEEKKSRLVVEESVKNGEDKVAVHFEGTMDKYSTFIAAVIVNYRNTVLKNFGSLYSNKEVNEALNEALKEFIDLDGTDKDVFDFSSKVFLRLDNIKVDRGEILTKLLIGLLEDIRKDIESDNKAEVKND